MEGKKLYRSQSDKMIAGVCGGLAQYLGADATLIRLLFALAVVLGFGGGAVIYLVMMFIVPQEPTSAAPIATPNETPKSDDEITI